MSSLLSLIDTSKQVITCMARRWPVVLGCVFCTLLLVIGFVRFRGTSYTSEMVVRPVTTSQTGKLSALLGNMGSSFNLSNLTAGSQIYSYIELLQSHVVANAMIKNDHVLDLLFGGGIDQKTGLWRPSIARGIKTGLYSIFGLAPSTRPDAADVSNLVNALLIVQQDTETGLITISCTHQDRKLCPALMLAAHKEAEVILNRATLAKANSIVQYGQTQLVNANLAIVRTALEEVISNAEQQIVMANLQQPIAAEILDGPTQPQVPSFPKPYPIILLSALLGLGIGGWLSVFLEHRTFSFTFQHAPQTGRQTFELRRKGG